MFYAGLLILTISSCNSLHAATQSPQVLLGDHQPVTILNELLILKDTNKQLGITEITSKDYTHKFQKNVHGANSFGYGDASWWFRFDLKVQSDEIWFLLIDQTVNATELFIEPKTSATKIDLKPRYTFLDTHRTPAWQLNLTRQQSYTVYLKVNNGHAILRLPLSLMTS